MANAPVRDWVLPGALGKMRRKLKGVDDGDRQTVDILAALLTEGLPAVEAACAEAIARGASIPPMSSRTSWHAAAIRPRRPCC